jgi:hypothetical protein
LLNHEYIKAAYDGDHKGELAGWAGLGDIINYPWFICNTCIKGNYWARYVGEMLNPLTVSERGLRTALQESMNFKQKYKEVLNDANKLRDATMDRVYIVAQAITNLYDLLGFDPARGI